MSIPELEECPHHADQILRATVAQGENFCCDMCLQPVHKGDQYWSCPQCHLDKCSYCTNYGTQIQEGLHVEVLYTIQVEHEGTLIDIRPKTTGVVTAVNSNSFGNGLTASITFAHHSGLSRTEQVDELQFKNLMVVQRPGRHGRMIFGLILISVLFVLGMVFHKELSVQLERFIAFCKRLGLWSGLLIMAVCTVLPVMMMPVFPMMALSGPLFTKIYDGNPWIGGSVAFACVFTGLWNGSVTAFALGKSCFKSYAEEAGKDNQYMQRLNSVIDRGGIKMVFMARSLPILPAEVFDYAVAVTSLRTWQYAVGCFGSAVPVAFWCYSTAQAAAAGATQTQAEGGEAQSNVGMKCLLIAINIVAVVVLTAVIVYTIKSEEHDANRIVGTIVAANPGFQNAKLAFRQVSRTLSRSHKSQSSPSALE